MCVSRFGMIGNSLRINRALPFAWSGERRGPLGIAGCTAVKRLRYPAMANLSAEWPNHSPGTRGPTMPFTGAALVRQAAAADSRRHRAKLWRVGRLDIRAARHDKT